MFNELGKCSHYAISRKKVVYKVLYIECVYVYTHIYLKKVSYPNANTKDLSRW